MKAFLFFFLSRSFLASLEEKFAMSEEVELVKPHKMVDMLFRKKLLLLFFGVLMQETAAQFFFFF